MYNAPGQPKTVIKRYEEMKIVFMLTYKYLMQHIDQGINLIKICYFRKVYFYLFIFFATLSETQELPVPMRSGISWLGGPYGTELRSVLG